MKAYQLLAEKETPNILEQNIHSLRDIYQCYTKQDIIEILKMHGIKGYSGYTKSDLVIYAVKNLLKPEIIERFFTCLRDDEIEAFQDVIKAKGIYKIDDVALYGRILDAGYCGFYGLEFIDIPEDVIEAYKQLDRKAFHKNSRSFIWGSSTVYYIQNIPSKVWD